MGEFHESVETLGRTANELESLAMEMPEARLRARPIPGKWSANEVLGHLADTEWIMGTRLRLMLAEDRPAIPKFEQDEWVAALGHNDVEPMTHVRRFRALREQNLEIWRKLGEAELARVGVHPERGETTLEKLREHNAWHDRHHIGQIRGLLAATERQVE